MAEKLISLDAAVKTLEKEISEFPIEQVFDPVYVRFKKRVVPRLLQDVINWLKKMPTVDAVEVVHGYNKYDHDSAFECSVCGFSDWDTYTADIQKYNYCPNCGAKMDGDGNG